MALENLKSIFTRGLKKPDFDDIASTQHPQGHGALDLMMLSSADAADYCTIAVTSSGATTIGTNDGAQFRKVIFTGTKLYHGKPMMTFKTNTGEQITINPSFHSFTIQETIIVEPEQEKENTDG